MVSKERPYIDKSLEELVGAILTIKGRARSYDGDQEPGQGWLFWISVGYYALGELYERLPTDDYNWWLELFRSTGAVKPETKNSR
mgnify:CR=1 FL=1